MQSPTFIDLFAGCGGLALGFKEAGFIAKGAVEFERNAATTYRINIDERIFIEDIAVVNDRGVWPKVDVVVGGPPCQGFSQLGARDPHDPRNALWREYARALKQTTAPVFVMENVPQLIKSGQFASFLKELSSDDTRFNVVHGVLNAAEYGVPQQRRRAIVIGSRLGQPTLPSATHGPRSPNKTPYRTVQEAFEGLPTIPDGRIWHSIRHGIRDFSRERYRAVPRDGGDRFQMQAALEAAGKGHLVPPCWRKKQTGTTDVFGRLWWDRPSVTIRTEFFKPEKGRYLHPTADRPITVREAARLQSFPDDFVFPASQSMMSVARQIGNAVPPRLAYAIALHVRRLLKDQVATQLQLSSMAMSC